MEERKWVRKIAFTTLTSTLLWTLRNELPPALDQRVDQFEQKLLEKYCTKEAGWYTENLQYKQAFQGLALVDARKRFLTSTLREEGQGRWWRRGLVTP